MTPARRIVLAAAAVAALSAAPLHSLRAQGAAAPAAPADAAPGAGARAEALDAAEPHAGDPLLAALVGRWVGDHVAGSVRLGERVRWQWALAGRFLECRLETSDPDSGKRVYEARGMLHPAGPDGRYELHWFDTRGAARRFTGTRTPDGAFRFEEAGDAAARDHATILLHVTGDEASWIQSGAAPGGPERPLFESRWRRAPEKQAKDDGDGNAKEKKKKKKKEEAQEPPAAEAGAATDDEESP